MKKREQYKGMVRFWAAVILVLLKTAFFAYVWFECYGDLGILFMGTQEVAYKCYCSRERVTAALISLGKAELEEIRDEGKDFPVECQFCDTVYRFTPQHITEILKKI